MGYVGVIILGGKGIVFEKIKILNDCGVEIVDIFFEIGIIFIDVVKKVGIYEELLIIKK